MNKAENEHKAPVGLRTVALFELVKGIAWLAGGVFCLTLLHSDVQSRIEHLLHFLHVDPAWGFAKLCIDKAAEANDQRLMAIAGFAGILALGRLVEAYGLWHEYHWAEWLAVLSAGLFLPIEVYHMWHRYPLHFYFSLTVFLGNIAVVVYLIRLLAGQHRRRVAEQKARELGRDRYSQSTSLPHSREPVGQADKI